MEEKRRSWKNLSKVSNEYPILLFPIRIETKYAGQAGAESCRIRFFVDQISIDSFEPRLTEKEVEDATQYWRDLYLFTWDDVTAGTASSIPPKVKDFLKHNFDVEWKDPTNITKADDDRKMSMTDSNTHSNSLSIELVAFDDKGDPSKGALKIVENNNPASFINYEFSVRRKKDDGNKIHIYKSIDLEWNRFAHKYGCLKAAYISKSVIDYDPDIRP